MKLKQKYKDNPELVKNKLVELKTSWWHTFDFGNDIVAQGKSGAQGWKLDNLPKSYTGKRVLDIGCADGFFSFDAESKGAKEVIMIDHVIRPTRVLMEELLETNVKFILSKTDDFYTNITGKFDVILFMGVLYHLRYPLLGLEQVASLLNNNGEIYLETLIDSKIEFPGMRFIEGDFGGATNNWWNPSISCVLALMRSVGLTNEELKSTNREKTRAFFKGALSDTKI